MADIPANHQKPDEFAPSRPGEDVEPVAGMTQEEWAKENAKALHAEAKELAKALADAVVPAHGGKE